MALLALDQLPLERRDQSSILMATSTKKLAVAKTLIKNFRRSLCEFLENSDEKDSVFELSISLFPLLDLDLQGEQLQGVADEG